MNINSSKLWRLRAFAGFLVVTFLCSLDLNVNVHVSSHDSICLFINETGWLNVHLLFSYITLATCNKCIVGPYMPMSQAKYSPSPVGLYKAGPAQVIWTNTWTTQTLFRAFTPVLQHHHYKKCFLAVYITDRNKAMHFPPTWGHLNLNWAPQLLKWKWYMAPE